MTKLHLAVPFLSGILLQVGEFLQDANYRTNQAPYEGLIAFSGRIEGSLSHLGPPTAPSNTASAALQAQSYPRSKARHAHQ